MKKVSLLILSAALIIGTSCKKKNNDEEANTIPPTITLNGVASVTIAVGDTYNDAGAYATDVNGSSVTVTTDASNVDPNTVGTYTVTYSATDADGNFAQKSRTVNVEITSQNWLNGWTVVHNVRAGTPAADLIGTACTITEFGGSYTFDHGGNNTTGTVSGQNVTISTSPVSVNLGTATYDLTGSGAINNTGDEIVINYHWEGTCTLCGNGDGVATYTKN